MGGSPESVVRAAHYGLPLVLAIIGGSPARFAPLADLYRRALEQFGHPLQPVAIHSPGYIADTDEEALDTLWPHYKVIIDRIGRERGWGPVTREHFEDEAGPNGALYAGSPETVAQKIAAAMRTIGASAVRPEVLERHPPARGDDGQHRAVRARIVVPRVRELLEAADAADAELDARRRRRSSGCRGRRRARARLTHRRPADGATTRRRRRVRPAGRRRPRGGAPAHGRAEPRGIRKPREERARDDRDEHVARRQRGDRRRHARPRRRCPR